MFEHKSIDNQKVRLLSASDGFLNESILETREPKNGESLEKAPRQQHAVAGTVLVERFLPPESTGDAWPHDACAAPWWEVVGHPPHGGLVADFNTALGGAYRRELDPSKNTVAYAAAGEDVVWEKGQYSVVRSSDRQELAAPTLLKLRAAPYS